MLSWPSSKCSVMLVEHHYVALNNVWFIFKCFSCSFPLCYAAAAWTLLCPWIRSSKVWWKWKSLWRFVAIKRCDWVDVFVCVSVHVSVCRFGHLMSCGLISPCSAQMACDYARLSKDYRAAQIERETECNKYSSNDNKLGTGWNENMRYVGSKKSSECGVCQHQRICTNSSFCTET